MKAKTYNNIRHIITFLIVILTFYSIYSKIVFVLFISIFFGMLILSFLRIFVNEEIEDERIKAISEKAALNSFKILLPIISITSIALYMGGEHSHYFLRGLGIILGYVSIIGILIYLALYFYFNKIFGG